MHQDDTTAPDTPAAAPTGAADAARPAASDDLDGYETTMSRLARRSRGWLALLLAAALVIPAGSWLVDEFIFQRSGSAVESELGEDADLVASVLLVRSIGCSGQVSTGSAFVADVDGAIHIVTNRHVVAGAGTVSLRRLTGGPSFPVAAHAVSPSADVAVLTPAEDVDVPPPLVLGGDPAPGEEVRLIGFPSARPYTTAGTVARVGPHQVLVELQVTGGASGSPVVGEDDRVVAQVYGRTGDGTGVATPAGALRTAIADAEPAAGC